MIIDEEDADVRIVVYPRDARNQSLSFSCSRVCLDDETVAQTCDFFVPWRWSVGGGGRDASCRQGSGGDAGQTF